MASEFKVYKDRYVKGGISYTRITTPLDYFTVPELVDWKLETDNHKEVSKTAKQIGTRVHNLIKMDFEKGKYSLTPNDSVSIRNCMKAYEEWKRVEKPKIIAMEQTMFNDKLRIAGTFDMGISCNNVNTANLVDIKTSASIKPNHWLQIAMYNYLAEGKYLFLSILRLDKFTGEYEYKTIPYDKRLVNIYLCLLSYYRYIVDNEDNEELDLSEVVEVNPFDSLLIQ
ncbi:hypothetical protein CCP1ISM_50038 [Azospirillaceae bacterium]